MIFFLNGTNQTVTEIVIFKRRYGSFQKRNGKIAQIVQFKQRKEKRNGNF
jgi:hypothetical protein